MVVGKWGDEPKFPNRDRPLIRDVMKTYAKKCDGGSKKNTFLDDFAHCAAPARFEKNSQRIDANGNEQDSPYKRCKDLGYWVFDNNGNNDKKPLFLKGDQKKDMKYTDLVKTQRDRFSTFAKKWTSKYCPQKAE